MDALGDDECGEVHVETRGTNQNGVTVSVIRYRIRIYKSGRHPFYRKYTAEVPLQEERFSAYRMSDNEHLMEQSGLYFEDFVCGEVYEHASSKVILPEEATRHALMSLNWDPKYIDPNVYHQHDSASPRGDQKSPPVFEVYLIGALSACTTRTFGRVVANLAWKNTSIRREVLPGESFTVRSEILSKRESKSRPKQGIMSVKTDCFDQKGEVVVSFERAFLIYKKGLGPYEKAGY